MASSTTLYVHPITGNVGIGTTTPKNTLDIEGFIKYRIPFCKFLGVQVGSIAISDSALLTNRTYYRLKYQTQIQNDELLYNTTNKYIKAPLSGLYFINASVVFSSGATGGLYYVYIVKNSTIGDSTTSASSVYNICVANAMLGGVSYNNVSCTTAVPLLKDDTIDVYVMYEDPASGGAYVRMGAQAGITWSNPMLTAYMISAS
jgi:hypothetical protein